MLVSTLLSGTTSAFAAPGDTTRVSVDSSGVQANGWSRRTTISGDGRFVAFASEASNLVTGDTNGAGDIFVHDRHTGATTRISVDSSGAQANGGSDYPFISNDSRYVAFYSDASNLVSGDTNGIGDIFVHDRQTGATTRISVDSSGNEANGENADAFVAISGDGRYVAFASEATNLVSGDTNDVRDIFVHDRQTGQTTRVSVDSSGAQANNSSGAPSISNDGRYVAFSSGATNLVGNDTNGKGDVFVHDRQTGSTTLVSVNSSGEQADGGGGSPDISGDGRYVVFLSKSNNLAPGADEYDALVYVHDRQTGQTTLASVYSDGYIMVTGILDQPTISSNGRFVAFSFYDKGNNNGILNIWVRDLQTSTSIEIEYGNESSHGSSLSADGSVVAFWSGASNLVSGDTNNAPDIFVHELASISDPNPSVVSVIQNCPRGCISPADPVVDFTVTFSEPVTGVTSDDFVVALGGGITGAFVTEIIGSGKEYIVAVNTGSGDGTLRLDLLDNDSIIDSHGNPLGGAGAGNGNFEGGDVYTTNKSFPVVTGSMRNDPSPTSAEMVHFTVTFSEEVSGGDTGNFVLSTTGSISGASVVEINGPGSTYVITVNTGTGDGTMRLDIIDNDNIMDSAGNMLGGPGAGNGNFTSGEAYTINKSTQDAPQVTSVLRADPNPTTATSVNFTVTFSEPVSGVDAGDFSLTTIGSLFGATITAASGSANTYTVSVATGNGDGSLRLDVLDNDSILDASGNPLGGSGAGNGNFTSGEEYTVSKTPPKLLMETVRSNGNNDGWVLESAEDSNQGGLKDSRATTFVLGDDALDRQLRAVLHFPTHYLPDNAVITRALLMIKGEALVGTDPFTTHQNILVDIRSGAFGFVGPFTYRGLQVSDFQSPADREAVGLIQNNPLNGWYYAWLDGSSFQYINLTGITQFRLRFQLDDDDDLVADYIRFYSGDVDRLPDRPQLVIEYYEGR
jgi:hypothetical protein